MARMLGYGVPQRGHGTGGLSAQRAAAIELAIAERFRFDVLFQRSATNAAPGASLLAIQPYINMRTPAINLGSFSRLLCLAKRTFGCFGVNLLSAGLTFRLLNQVRAQHGYRSRQYTHNEPSKPVPSAISRDECRPCSKQSPQYKQNHTPDIGTLSE